jgi:hypothetical protein
MSAPDFYFAVNATARHIHDQYGKDVLVDYWRSLGREYYAARAERWRAGGAAAIAEDWAGYFLQEPSADVITSVEQDAAHLEVRVCPAIKHLCENGRDIVPYFCEHCDHTCGGMAERAGFKFVRSGGMGSCRQSFYPSNSNADVE